MARRIFISDVHMGARRRPGRYEYDWLDYNEGVTFVKFLKHIGDIEDGATGVVLLGDILDNWICPHDERPPSFGDIFAAHADVVDAIGELLNKGMSVTFVEGNHDMHIARTDLDAALGGHANLKCADRYLAGGVHAEHGNSFDPFNEKPNGPGVLYGFPIGYFISRIVAAKLAIKNSEKKPTIEIACNAFKALVGHGDVAVKVLDTFIEDAGLDANLDFTMPDGAVVGADVVRAAYRDTDLSLSIKDLRPRADDLSKDRDDIKLVIFGHTHRKVLVPLDLADDTDPNSFTRVYANGGTWSSGEAPGYIEVEPDSRDIHMNHVRLMEWKEGGPRRRDTLLLTI